MSDEADRGLGPGSARPARRGDPATACRSASAAGPLWTAARAWIFRQAAAGQIARPVSVTAGIDLATRMPFAEKPAGGLAPSTLHRRARVRPPAISLRPFD